MEGERGEHPALEQFGEECLRALRAADDAASYLERLGAIADLHTQGYDLDLSALFSGGFSRVPLPTYPFARERYWVPEPDGVYPRNALPCGPEASALSAEGGTTGRIWSERVEDEI